MNKYGTSKCEELQSSAFVNRGCPHDVHVGCTSHSEKGETNLSHPVDQGSDGIDVSMTEEQYDYAA